MSNTKNQILVIGFYSITIVALTLIAQTVTDLHFVQTIAWIITVASIIATGIIAKRTYAKMTVTKIDVGILVFGVVDTALAMIKITDLATEWATVSVHIILYYVGIFAIVVPCLLYITKKGDIS